MTHLIHPDDMPSPRFGGWADDFNTYEEACEFYGCDTPAQVAAEEEWRAVEEHIAEQDEIEARGGPCYRVDPFNRSYDPAAFIDPFADVEVPA